jgi:gliding motility-associated-like protein
MKSILGLFFLLFTFFVRAQGDEIWIYPNKGQWDAKINYKIDLQAGKMYLENNRFTYHFYESPHKHQHTTKRKSVDKNNTIHNHVIQQTFIGANPSAHSSIDNSPHYTNYFIGKDTSTWRSNIHATQEITYSNFYPNIDMYIDAHNQKLEYSFKIAPNADPSQIKYTITGTENITIDASGNLHYRHGLGEIIEQKLIAWNLDTKGNKTLVPIKFTLKNNLISYEFPNGYDKKQVLLIDPELIFSSFSGATSDNWGFTATPDEKGNLYAGGISFGIGYPTTTGAFDITYHGGTEYYYSNNGATMTIPGFDISISKFSADGTKLFYSTYLGGNSNETPHSIIVNSNNELYLLGATGSADFPTSTTAYDKTFNGGSTFDNKELTFPGSDIIITKFSEDGSQLLGSTYLGGTEIDGLNVGDLVYNYGDDFRGDINLTKENDVLIVSTSRSSDFPTQNAFQSQLKGTQDAVITKFSPDLSSIIWSTYFGGTGDESGNSIQTSSTGEVFITGGTTSTSLPINSTFHGGTADGYILKISKGMPQILSGKYVGTPEFDQSYFVQLDNDNEVYLFGQTNGNFPITPGKYGIPNAGQFIAKYTNNLATLSWSTTIGAGTGEIEISPTAFSVSRCADIYISGWGGKVNVENSKAKFSSAVNFPITDDAFQKTTLGDNFYLGVLSKDATKLKYGSYIGGLNTSYNHVDGGTSRFSKTGGIYHAVCGGCGAQINGFTTTPGVVSTTNNSSNCNLAAFKFELNKTKAIASFTSESACIDTPIKFKNTSINANKFEWLVNKKIISLENEPTHIFTDTGNFVITMIAIDSTGCMDPDTTSISIKIIGGTTQITEPEIAICPNNAVKLQAKKGDVYAWSPVAFVTDSTSQITSTTKLAASKEFKVVSKLGCFTTIQTFPVKVFPNNSALTKNQEICRGTTLQLQASGGYTYNWFPATYLDKSNIASVQCKADSTITYYVTITTQDNCSKKDSVRITVIQPDAKIVQKDTVTICQNTSLLLNFSHCNDISISPNIWITPKSKTLYTVTPFTDIDYVLTYSNVCGNHQEKFHVKVTVPNITAEKDTSICSGGKAIISCKGGIDYIWLNPESIHYLKNHELVEVSPKKTITYKIKGIDAFKCVDTAYVMIQVFKQTKVNTEYQYLVHWGEEIKLKAEGNNIGTYVWSPSNYLSCSNCQYPNATPKESMDYKVVFTDKNSCKDSSIIHIIFESSIYIPNTFTPNGADGNDRFKAEGENITNFQLDIYNRWGENIISLLDIQESWDGTFHGIPCKDGTYTWKLRYVDSFGDEHRQTGHINLIR